MLWIQRWNTFNHVWSRYIISKMGKPVHRWTGSFVKSLSTLFSVHFFPASSYVTLQTWILCCATINTFFFDSIENACTSAKLISSICWSIFVVSSFFCPKANFSFVMSCSCYLFVSSLLALHACLFVLQLSVCIVWGKRCFYFSPK